MTRFSCRNGNIGFLPGAVCIASTKLVSEFFSAFRSNFRQAAVFSLISGLVLGILFLECVYLYSAPEVPLWFLYIFYFMILTVVAVTLYAWH